jgi:hypothetical protein
LAGVLAGSAAKTDKPKDIAINTNNCFISNPL